MKHILQCAMEKNAAADTSDPATLALMDDGLLDSENRLTREGRLVATHIAALRKQCQILGLHHEIWRLPKSKRPELAVMAALNKDNCKVAFCEGGAITLLLYCLCFDRLYAIYTTWASASGYRNPSARAQRHMYCVRFGCNDFVLKDYLTTHPELPSQMVADIAGAGEADLLRCFDILMDWQRQPPMYSEAIPPGCWRLRNWVGVDREFIRALFRAFGAARCAVIAQRFLADPFLGSKGWPDLICVQGSTVRLIEVKTTDKLLPSQIVKIPKIMDVVQVPIQVVQVRWEDKQ